jgi:two-component system sensor histidine kinase/response regulator
MASCENKALILIVEDDQLMAEGIADILSMEGYRVETALNGPAALAKMRSQTPDLVLSDISMPEIDGHDFCTLVRGSPEWRTLPFIFLTALGQGTDQRRALELGADYYLTKPFEPDDLLLAVRTRLQRAADHQAATEAALADLRTSILTTLNHEFRIPLTYITGYSQLLADDGQEMDKETYQHCANALLNGAERLRRLVENVLLLTQIDSGELTAVARMFPQQTADLHSVAHNVIEARRSEARARQVELDNQICPDLPPVAIRKEYIGNVIDHLVDNAIKFSNEGGRVTLASSRRDQYVEVTVNDDGIGIRPDALASVFDSFRQVDRHKQEQQGAGLGLAIVRGLVQAHNGFVGIDSQPNVGTTVKLRLPVA